MLSTQPLEEGGFRFESQLGHLPPVRPQCKLLNLCEPEFPFLKDGNYNPTSQAVVRTEQYIKYMAAPMTPSSAVSAPVCT